MAWNEGTARERIRGLIASVPQADIVVEDFLRFSQERSVTMAKAGMSRSEPGSLVRIPRNRAITTHAVHVYANLIGFNDQLMDAGRETEGSHERSLQFLHAHYSACHELIARFDLQRVDFHGSRLHAVVLTPIGEDREGERIAKAIAFAAAFREMVARTSERYGPQFQTGVRIGIDSGPAVAMDGGKRNEPDPVFIGSPANHAAKLADGAEEGVYLSARVQRLVSGASSLMTGDTVALAKSLENSFLEEGVFADGFRTAARRQLDEAFEVFTGQMDLMKSVTNLSDASFRFHHREPPLKTIDFLEHPPSNTIRMPLASIAADLAGFTAYIDQAMATGRVAEAVANLHVLRGEMAAVLRDDFGGRKVRFVGDNIHGVLAEGDARNTDAHKTIEEAVLAAGGIRSSFDLCRTMLPGVGALGIAIGIDFGPTPICRIGMRGDASVRCASSRATCVAEAEQQDCSGVETGIGEAAYAAASGAVRLAFGHGRKIPNLTYVNATMLIGTMPSPYVGRSDQTPMRAHQPAPPMRAHCRP